MVALFAITAYTFATAFQVLSSGSKSSVQVNMKYVLAFGIIGFMFDSISLTCFYLNERAHMKNASQRKKKGLSSSVGMGYTDNEDDDDSRLNMRSALMHAGGDLMRSTATIVSGSIALLGHTDPAKVGGCVCVFCVVWVYVCACVCMGGGVEGVACVSCVCMCMHVCACARDIACRQCVLKYCMFVCLLPPD